MSELEDHLRAQPVGPNSSPMLDWAHYSAASSSARIFTACRPLSAWVRFVAADELMIFLRETGDLDRGRYVGASWMQQPQRRSYRRVENSRVSSADSDRICGAGDNGAANYIAYANISNCGRGANSRRGAEKAPPPHVGEEPAPPPRVKSVMAASGDVSTSSASRR